MVTRKMVVKLVDIKLLVDDVTSSTKGVIVTTSEKRIFP